MTKAQNRYRASRLVLFVTLWLTLFVLSVKVSAGWATRSLSILAESLHTLITSFSILLSLLTMTAPDRQTRREVFAHSKRETVVVLLFAAFLGFACLTLVGMSAQQLESATHGGILPFPVRVSLPLIYLLSVVLVASLGIALLGFYKAKALNSLALRFNARQILKDVGLTILLLVGLLGVWWGVIWLDLLVAVLLVILVVVSYWGVLCFQLPQLVQPTAIAPEVLAQIARQVGGVTHCYQIQSRGVVGRLVYVQMHLILHPEVRILAPKIAERIEDAIQECYGPIQATFYIDDDMSELEVASNYYLPEEANSQSDWPDSNEF